MSHLVQNFNCISVKYVENTTNYIVYTLSFLMWLARLKYLETSFFVENFRHEFMNWKHFVSMFKDVNYMYFKVASKKVVDVLLSAVLVKVWFPIEHSCHMSNSKHDLPPNLNRLALNRCIKPNYTKKTNVKN